MEASEKAVEIAKNTNKLNVVQALSFDELSEDFKRAYNIITAFEVLEHVYEPMKFLKEIHSLLDESGVLILSCPPFYKFENTAKGYRKYKWWYNDYPPHHVTRWKPFTLHYALKKAGYPTIDVLVKAGRPDVSKAKNVGEKSLKVIDSWLKEKGYSWSK